MKMTTSIIILLAGIGLAILIINCKGQKKMKSFRWDASACAPLMYPVELYTGYFSFENGGSCYIPKSAFEHGGWGESAHSFDGRSESSSVPVGLDVTWISYTENKFYTGSFKLPKDTIAKLFEEGFTVFNQKMHDTYDNIIAGLAPGGVVVVWMRGQGGRAVEIGRYQASETRVSIQEFVPTADI